jgi:y4mF family transcriptional regulator
MIDEGEAEALVHLGDAVRRRRRQLGLTQVELAELAGCSPRSVFALEKGKPTQQVDVLLSVLRALGLTLRLEAGKKALVVPDRV